MILFTIITHFLHAIPVKLPEPFQYLVVLECVLYFQKRIGTLQTRVLQTDYSQQKLEIKMLDKSMEKLTKHTKKLLESEEIKYEGPMTEGQECKGCA